MHPRESKTNKQLTRKPLAHDTWREPSSRKPRAAAAHLCLPPAKPPPASCGHERERVYQLSAGADDCGAGVGVRPCARRVAASHHHLRHRGWVFEPPLQRVQMEPSSSPRAPLSPKSASTHRCPAPPARQAPWAPRPRPRPPRPILAPRRRPRRRARCVGAAPPRPTAPAAGSSPRPARWRRACPRRWPRG